MTMYAAFLRGVNVGGRKMPMAQVRDCLERAGLRDVATLLASGNVVFTAGGDPASVRAQVAAAIGQEFGYDCRLVLLDRPALERIAAQCPWVSDESHHAYVLLSDDAAVLDALAQASVGAEEELARGHGALYWRVTKGQTLETPFAKASARPLGVVTNRNLNTIRRVLSAMDHQAGG